MPWTRFWQCGTGPTTAVQVDYRVTRSLTVLLAQNGSLRWALSERAIIPLPRRNNAFSTIEGNGIHHDTYSDIHPHTYVSGWDILGYNNARPLAYLQQKIISYEIEDSHIQKKKPCNEGSGQPS